MLVLRLLLMVLTIICLMDGHAEVLSSTTGIRNGGNSPTVKPNEPGVQIVDRKKKPKKPKKSKKPGKKKGKKPKPNKPKPTKPVTTTPLMTTSTLKTTTILTTPTTTTTETTTTTPIPTTTTEATTSTATASTITTTPTKTMTTTAITSSPPMTADSGAGGECKATNGKPCIFPFKDGNEEYNECKNEGGKYFWCATSVYDSGKYKHWSYCPNDGSCPIPGNGECRATNNKPCVFPFKDGNKEYNECADHGGKYFWCATGTNSAGKYTAWSECPKDGSCPLPQKTTTPAMTSTATAASTTPLTTGTTAATDQMEEKVLDTLENLVLGESRDDSLQMVHMLDKKLDTIIKDLEGEASKTDLSNSDDMLSESGKLNLSIKRVQDDKVRDGTELGKGLMFVLSTVDSMKSVGRLSGDCCQDCKSKYPDTELAEYWETLDTCYCYKKMKYLDGTEVEPKTRSSSEFTTKACDSLTEDTCCETLTISSTGGTAQHQGARLGSYKIDGEHNKKPVYKQQEGSKILFFSEYVGFEWVVGSSVNSGGGLRSKPGSSEACPSDVKQWEYYVPGTTNTWVVDSTFDAKCDGEKKCGIDTKLDSTRFLAELNTAYIFNTIDKTQDPTLGYRTQVFDVVTFDKNDKPRHLFEERRCLAKEEDEVELVTLFLTAKENECNKLTFEDAKNNAGYYPVFVSNSCDDLTGPIEQFITDAQNLKIFFNGKLPKLCATLLMMEFETADLRKKELLFIFNYYYNNDKRAFGASTEKVCVHIEDTVDSILQSEIFDTKVDLFFKEEKVVVSESEKSSIVVVIRNSTLETKALGFIETRFDTEEHNCVPASIDDIVPLSQSIVFFNENEKEGIVIVRLKQDDTKENTECFTLTIKEDFNKRGKEEQVKSQKQVIKDFKIREGTNDKIRVTMDAERVQSIDLFTEALAKAMNKNKPFETSSLTEIDFKGKKLNEIENLILFKDICDESVEGGNLYPNRPKEGGNPIEITIPTSYFEIPNTPDRLKYVIHQIGHMILKYGRKIDKKDTFVYIKLDSILYQFCLDKQSNRGMLYSRSIGCFYGDGEGFLTKDECLLLKKIDATVRVKIDAQYQSLSYPRIVDILEDILRENSKIAEIIAMKNLYRPEPEVNQGQLKNNFQIARESGNEKLFAQAFFAAEMSMDILAELIRFPDSIPSTLKLIKSIENKEVDWKDYSSIDYSFTHLHPMTRASSWVLKDFPYKTQLNEDIEQVGFMEYLELPQEEWDALWNEETEGSFGRGKAFRRNYFTEAVMARIVIISNRYRAIGGQSIKDDFILPTKISLSKEEVQKQLSQILPKLQSKNENSVNDEDNLIGT